jgi:hypothetical protein
MRPSSDQCVTQHFDQRAVWWDRIYQEESLETPIPRRRQMAALGS